MNETAEVAPSRDDGVIISLRLHLASNQSASRGQAPSQRPELHDGRSHHSPDGFHPFSVPPYDSSPDDVVSCSMRVAGCSTATPLRE